jgi:hypothetical protein
MPLVRTDGFCRERWAERQPIRASADDWPRRRLPALTNLTVSVAKKQKNVMYFYSADSLRPERRDGEEGAVDVI